MAITEVNRNAGTCSDTGKWYEVNGQEFNTLKTLVTNAMAGANSLPRLVGATQSHYAKDKAYNPMSVETLAVAEWIKENPDLYRQLESYHLKSVIEGCKYQSFVKGEQVLNELRVNACLSTVDTPPASPDIYKNLRSLLEWFSDPRHSSEKSITYFVSDVGMPGCQFAVMHHGVLSFVLPDRCQAGKK